MPEGTTAWHVGQLVTVESRTWAGINRQGGAGKITKIHYWTDSDGVMHPENFDIKYTISGGADHHVGVEFVKALEFESRGGRRRRGRDFLDPAVSNKTSSSAKKNASRSVAVHRMEKKRLKSTPTKAPPKKRSKKSSQCKRLVKSKLTKKRGKREEPKPAQPPPTPSTSSSNEPSVRGMPSYVSIADGMAEISPLPEVKVKTISNPIVSRNKDRKPKPKIPRSKPAKRQLIPPNPVTCDKSSSSPAACGHSYPRATNPVAARKSSTDEQKFPFEPDESEESLLEKKPPADPSFAPADMLSDDDTTSPGELEITYNNEDRRIPLRTVFHKESEKARVFVNSVVGAPPKEYRPAPGRENTPSPQPDNALATTLEQMSEHHRYIHRRACDTLRRHPDGLLDEDKFFDKLEIDHLMSPSTRPNVTREEIQEVFAYMEKNNSVFRSHGMVYLI